MTTPAVTSLLLSPEPDARKKRVLLVDQSTASRELRADTMRKLGMDVDCAIDISEARLWWKADLYHLVLLNVENEMGTRDKFCEEISGAAPPQQFAFLVGKPEYLANVPGLDAAPGAENTAILTEDGAEPSAILDGRSQRWGIMEASKRISAVRSISAARTKARRERPTPPRDMETRDSRRLSRMQAEFDKIEIH
jgi:CheY-like chemotaxis protein